MREDVGGVALNPVKAEAARVLPGGDVGGAEKPVPEAEADGEVLIDGARIGVAVVPEVHVWPVDYVLQRAQADFEVGVGEVADGGVEDAVGEHGFHAKATEGGKGIEEDTVDDDLEAVKAPVADPVHLDDAVVDFVDPPEEGDAVEEVVDTPLREVEDEKHDEELQGDGEAGHEVGRGDGGEGEAERESADEDAEILAVEDEIGEVRKEAPAEDGLGAAGPEALEDEEKQGEAEEPEGVAHAATLATFQPRAFHSGKPAAERRARRPNFVRRATASSERKQ